MLEKIISGGQTGADFAGLCAARVLGLKTGGTAPKGWRICLPDGSDGSAPWLADFGLIEHESREYPPRTRQNVADSDGTLWVGYTGSGGAKLTIKTCQQLAKPYMVNPTPEVLREWVVKQRIRVLNVAGNRDSDFNPGIFGQTAELLVKAFFLSCRVSIRSSSIDG